MVNSIKKNKFQYELGEKWAREFFNGAEDHSFILETRAHDYERDHLGASTDVALTKKQIGDLLTKFEFLETKNNDLVIIRTYSKGGQFSPAYCFIVVANQQLLENNKKTPLYFRLSGKNGKEDWLVKGKGLVQYFPIDTSLLETGTGHENQ
ncbi:hypothetical protein [Paenibacillus borealis]|uniref:Uncharacterized protein n=1 Tax=Paenibacillus borealis TaxID=160799 RepID=A0A089LHV7_PAEBO|nr:hypothetical protein [Paenibacillus borealis]AIQ59695.1 hypothetical protein PBOR_24110 [Paenibacillus borealis]